jgi:hypothetical protein
MVRDSATFEDELKRTSPYLKASSHHYLATK